MEVIVVDSNSSDGTIEIAKKFLSENPQINFRLLVEEKRKGKSHALNYALAQSQGEVIVVSDADCFWPSDILEKAIPFLADSSVGAISGPKILLNSEQSWVTRMEDTYLRSANLLRLGESKSGSTGFFEGGFSAFKKEAFKRFDDYATGSDDCGTVISVIERNHRAMLVPEAKFFTTFPTTFRGKIAIKSRRTNQLVRLFGKYLYLSIKNRAKLARKSIVPNILLYLISPIAFFVFLFLTSILLVNFPLLLLSGLLLLIPSVRFYSYMILESNALLLISLLAVLIGKRFSMWRQPEDRAFLTKETLSRFSLI
jgi:cellulose synthase/poly-beta-1,6-N-acetylglucosamine synthase-like glycosyltransferase